ncbi:hypothetical protein, partial [Klebsiella pneumoniae]|uniref:hypothetical protein n=1 Tax=Klebsiella pneumoniae TaxID=573 RepID=UPI004046110C
ITTAVLVPVVVALVVLVNVLGGDEDGDDGDSADPGPADVEGTTAPERADLPPLPVEVPPVTPEAEQYCPTVMSGLPLELAG